MMVWTMLRITVRSIKSVMIRTRRTRATRSLKWGRGLGPIDTVGGQKETNKKRTLDIMVETGQSMHSALRGSIERYEERV